MAAPFALPPNNPPEGERIRAVKVFLYFQSNPQQALLFYRTHFRVKVARGHAAGVLVLDLPDGGMTTVCNMTMGKTHFTLMQSPLGPNV